MLLLVTWKFGASGGLYDRGKAGTQVRLTGFRKEIESISHLGGGFYMHGPSGGDWHGIHRQVDQKIVHGEVEDAYSEPSPIPLLVQ